MGGSGGFVGRMVDPALICLQGGTLVFQLAFVGLCYGFLWDFRMEPFYLLPHTTYLILCSSFTFIPSSFAWASQSFVDGMDLYW